MRIKRLEIYGFKSFPYRVSLPFPPGISAIVGPNGSGKSNIVDALRWVLGEQSLKRLRVKNAEDLLFAGDHGRAPGFAEVRLVLENDGKAPEKIKDWPEIVVARRLYRTGESEFLLNNRACRLKDIQYLFLDTGVNPRGYGLIDQGEVGKFLEWSPQERRFFLEELAGISRYRFNREETRRNLARTRENLARVEDLLAEIRDRVRHLEEQARLAEEFLRLREKLRRLSLTRLAILYLKALREREKAEKALERLEEARSELEKRREHLIPLYEEALRRARTLKRISREKEEILHNLKAELRERIEKLRRLYREEAEIGKRLERERTRAEALSEELERLEEERRRLEEEIASGEELLAREKEAFRELEKRYLEHRKAMGDLEREVRKRGEEEVSLKERLRNADRLLQKLEKELERILDRENRIVKTRAELSSRRMELSRRRKELEERLELVEEKRREVGEEEEATRKKEEGLRAEVKVLEERLRDIAGEERALLREKEGLERVIRGALPPELRRLRDSGEGLQLLAEVLEIPPERIPAAEALLGEKLTYPVIRDTKALEDLLPREGVRGVFVAPGEELEILRAQLEDLDTREELKSLTAERPVKRTFFRREKVLFEPPGFLIKVEAGESGLLALRKRLREIAVRLGELEEERKGLGKKKAELERALQDLREYAEILAGKRDTLERERKALAGEVGNLRREGERLSQEEALLDRERRELEERREISVAEKKALEEERAILERELARMEGEGREVRQRWEELKRSGRELERAFREREARISELAGRLEALRRRRNELEGEKRKVEGRRRNALQQESLLSEELNFVRNMLRNERENRSRLEEEMERVEKEWLEIREALREAEARVAELETEEKNLERELGRLQEKRHRLELDRVEAEMTLEHLRREAREHQDTEIESFLEETRPVRQDLSSVEEEMVRLRERLAEFPPVNLAAAEELKEARERLEFLSSRRSELLSAAGDLEKALKRLDEESRKRLREALAEANRKLAEVFPLLFEGGRAELYFTESEDPLSAGLDLRVKLPGKPVKHLTMLSGGEKALCALAVLFAFYLVKPGPFCILDEVDAPLDEANTLRFNELLKKLKEHSQVILVTHNPRVMEIADALFGVTMEERGVSKVVSVRLD